MQPSNPIPPQAPGTSPVSRGLSSRSGKRFNAYSTVPSSSSREKVQVEYRMVPPGRSMVTAAAKISRCRGA